MAALLPADGTGEFADVLELVFSKGAVWFAAAALGCSGGAWLSVVKDGR